MGSDELVERLRDADRNSVQRMNGSRIFGEAADRIEALTAQLAEARESERAAVVAWLRRMAVKYDMSGGHDEAVTLEIAADAFEAGEHLT